MTTTQIWQRLREAVDRLLAYDPSPPVVIDYEGRKVIVSDGLPPETTAMTHAMYSRDPKSFLIHLQHVLKKGAQKFMASFYVGYGHKSIGDCGTTNVCIEGGSMLVAKEVEDTELFNGQEGSTRYMDMSKERIANPLGTEHGRLIQERWMSTYTYALSVLIEELTAKYPLQEGDNPVEYRKAIRAKAFDVARGLLPAGCPTNVGWHTTLRQAWDHTQRMRFHPLKEVREAGERALEALRRKYPSSFNFKHHPEQDEYLRLCAESRYADLNGVPFDWSSKVNTYALRQDRAAMELLAKRPLWAELPKRFKRFGEIQFRFLLDFASFRDLHRHRSCTQLMPLLTMRHGFNSWYLSQMPEKVQKVVLETLAIQEVEVAKIEDPLIRQYYIAMGYNVMCELTGGLPGVVYIAEMRSRKTVHPTLRPIAQQFGQVLKQILPEMAVFCDTEPDEWSLARGKQDIVKV